MTKKSLQSWYNENSITYNEKNRLNIMGIYDYDCYKLYEFKKILECEKVAKVNWLSGEKINWIGFFSTWFNNNCALVIWENDNSYRLTIFIHEPKQYGMLEHFLARWIADDSNIESLKQRAYRAESNLKYGENPILEIHTGIIHAFAHAWRGIYLTELPEVISETLPSSALSASNPDYWLKPFDIIERKIKDSNQHHTAIYLGNGGVAQVYGPVSLSASSVAFSHGSFEGMMRGANLGSSASLISGLFIGTHRAFRMLANKQGAKISSWQEFLAGNPAESKILRYHPVMPFKNPEGENGMINHIARAVSSYEYDEGQYSYTGIGQGRRESEGNCQHFANRVVLGLNFSQEGTKFKKKVPLGNEIADVDRRFRNLSIKDYNILEESRDGINNCVEAWKTNYQGEQFESRIEVSPDCRIQ